MGKLIGQLFKEDFKSIILWLLLPFVSTLIFLQLLDVFYDSPLLGVGMVVSFTLLTIGPLITLGIAAKNDNERFYNKNGAFYSTLPLSSSSITGARLINFILVGLMIAVATNINAYGSDLGEIFNSISDVLSQIGSSKIFLGLLAIFTVGLYIVNIMMLGNTVGSTKFGKKSKWIPIIIFLVLFFVVGKISAKFQTYALDQYMSYIYNYGSTHIEVSGDVPTDAMALPIIINIVISAILYGLTYYFHDKKLSVN